MRIDNHHYGENEKNSIVVIILNNVRLLCLTEKEISGTRIYENATNRLWREMLERTSLPAIQIQSLTSQKIKGKAYNLSRLIPDVAFTNVRLCSHSPLVKDAYTNYSPKSPHLLLCQFLTGSYIGPVMSQGTLATQLTAASQRPSTHQYYFSPTPLLKTVV